MKNLFLIVMFFAVVCRVVAIEESITQDVINRREEVSDAIGKNSLLIVFSAPARAKTGDVSYEYRQSNHLYYLTGITQPDTTLVLMPGNKARKEFIFVSDRNPSRETWTGKILSTEEVRKISGIQNVYSSSRFESFIDSVLNQNTFDTDRYVPSREYDQFFEDLRNGTAQIYIVFSEKPGLQGELTPEMEFANRVKERFVGITIRDAWPLLTRMRQVKSSYEMKMLREAIDITAEGLLQAYSMAKPGIWEYEIEAAIEQVYKKRDAFDWAFPSIIASGPNATILHYESSDRQLQAGDLLLMDVGAEYGYYAADITRTIPVNGKFSPEQAAVYQIVYDAQEAAMKAVKRGAKLPDIHLAGTAVVKEGLKKLGLITDTQGDQYKTWFMHGVSHWLGMDVHDTGERWRPFEPGMVFTIEPGIYIRGDALDHISDEKFREAIRPAFEKYKNIGVRIEDDILVTKDGYELLSKKIPRALPEIEKAMQ